MPGERDLARIVGEWIAKADNDLKAAKLTLAAEREAPTDTVCFHAQQCVEKYVKALLVLGGYSFPKTHDLEAICAILPESWRPDLPPKLLQRFTDYATVTRYPGEYAEIELEEAKQAVAVARRIREHVRSIVPPEALPGGRG